MKTLQEHNAEIFRRLQPRKTGNGIACPNCGKELFDSDNSMALTTNPIQYLIHCESCDYKGTRY